MATVKYILYFLFLQASCSLNSYAQTKLFSKCDSLNGIEGLQIGTKLNDTSIVKFDSPKYRHTPRSHLKNWWKLSYNVELFGYYQTDSITVRLDKNQTIEEINFYLGEEDYPYDDLVTEFKKILGESVQGYTYTAKRVNQYWFGSDFTILLEHRTEIDDYASNIYCPLTVRFLPELNSRERRIMGTPEPNLHE